MHHRPGAGALLLAALATSACNSLPPAAATAELPARFQEWTLFDVDGRLVYAVDGDDARAAAALAATAGQDFRARTGREPTARIVLVADHDAWLPVNDPCRRLELAVAGEAALRRLVETQDGEADADGDRHDDTPASCEELKAAAADTGVEPGDMLGLIGHPLPLNRLVVDFGLPAEAGAAWDWVVLLPTEESLDDNLERVMDAALRKELSFAQRLLAAPLLPWMRGLAVEALLAQQQVLIFELHAAVQADWSPEQRGQLARDYETVLEGEVEDQAAAAEPPTTATSTPPP